MIDLGNLAETLGLRRKKSVVERFQDAAEDVVDSVMERVRPSRPSPMSRVTRLGSTVGSSVRNIELPDLPSVHLPSVHMPDVRLPEMRLPEMRLPDVKLPEIHAGERLGDAAGKVKHGAAATGTAAVGVAAGIGGFFSAIFSGLWWLTTFVVKVAILGGVAYAGWQYLQSRRTQDSWSGSPGATSSPSYPSSMYGSVGTSTGSGSSATATAAAGS